MVKTHPRSRFVLRTIEQIRDSADVVLQFEKSGQVFTETHKDAYFCEVVAAAGYNPTPQLDTATVGKLAAEIERVNEDNRKLRRKITRLESAIRKYCETC